MKLWTIYCDYGGTGEGRTIKGLITYAEDETDALLKFEKQFEFGDFFVKFAQAEKGVVLNETTEYIFSEKTLKSTQDLEGKANICIFGSIHFNFS